MQLEPNKNYTPQTIELLNSALLIDFGVCNEYNFEQERKKTEHTNILLNLKKLRHQNIHVMLSYAIIATIKTKTTKQVFLTEALKLFW